MRSKSKCIFGCHELGAYMHRFPQPERRTEAFAKWMSTVGNKLKEAKPLKVYKNKRVCNYHFRPEDKVSGHRLVQSAVPCLYLNGLITTPALFSRLEHNYCVPQVNPNNNMETTTMDNLCSSDLGKFDHTYPSNSIHMDHSYVKDKLISRSAAATSATAAASNKNTVSEISATEDTGNDDAGFENDNCIDVPDSPENQTAVMSSRNRKKCIVCDRRQGVKNDNVFLASLPIDPDRCRLWVKAIGQEDLVHLPIEKLHELKHVCDLHFDHTDFNEKRNRLLSHAVPKFHLPFPPLREELFVGFPLRIGQQIEKTKRHLKLHDPEKLFVEFSQQIAQQKEKPMEQHKQSEPEELCVDFSKQIAQQKEKRSGHEKQTLPDKLTAECPLTDDWNKIMEKAVLENEFVEVPFGELDETEDVSMYHDDESSFAKNVSVPSTDTGYVCNECGTNIMGFRYTCVQCADWDLCGACEARAAHGAHYMLRVPGPRPYKEIQAVLSAIRHQLLSENLSPELSDDMKVEVKEEPEEGDPFASVAADLGHHLQSDIEEESESLNQSIEEIGSDADDPPSRKRARLASLANTEQDLSHEETVTTCASAMRTPANEYQTRTVAPDNLTKTLNSQTDIAAHGNRTITIADSITGTLADNDSEKSHDQPARKIIGINSITGEIIYHPSKPYPTKGTNRSFPPIPHKNIVTGVLPWTNQQTSDMGRLDPTISANGSVPPILHKNIETGVLTCANNKPVSLSSTNQQTSDMDRVDPTRSTNRSVSPIPHKNIATGVLTCANDKPESLPPTNQQISGMDRLDPTRSNNRSVPQIVHKKTGTGVLTCADKKYVSLPRTNRQPPDTGRLNPTRSTNRSVPLILHKKTKTGVLTWADKKPVSLPRTNQQTSDTGRLDGPELPAPTKTEETNRLPLISFKEKSKRLVFKIPKGTDPSHVVRALTSKVSVRIEALEKSKRYNTRRLK